MNNIVCGFAAIPSAWRDLARSLCRLESILPRLRNDLCRAVRLAGRAEGRSGCCSDLPSAVLKREDPLLYSQEYLLKRGLGVTWDNPDIDVMRNGAVVAPHDLHADTEYQVRVRVWNGSYDAPAVGLPVVLSYLSFGIGTKSTFVGTDHVTLGPKGSASAPAFATVDWRTPPTPGHYCLQARLVWADDANPDNNMGQKNTQVGQVQSPAEFVFPVENNTGIARRFFFEADTFALRPMPSCGAVRPQGRENVSRTQESRQRWAAALAEQGYGKFPVGNGWRVAIEPSAAFLQAGEHAIIRVTAEPLDPHFDEPHPLNIHGFVPGPDGGRVPVGGVTFLIGRG